MAVNRKIARANNALRMGKLGRSRLARAIALGILLGGARTAAAPPRAADSEWTGATSDEWTEIGNWVVPPTSGSFVLIDALAPNPARLNTIADVGAMVVGDQAQGDLTIAAGGQLSVLGTRPAADPYGSPLGLVIANAPGSQGTVRVDGAGARLVAVQNTLVGNGGTGTLSVSGGGTAELGLDEAYAETLVGFGYYGWGDSSAGVGHVTVDGAGSSLTYGGGMNVLNGTVDVTEGGQLVAIRRPVDGTTFWVDGIGFGLPADGEFPGLVGDANVSVRGAGSAWHSANAINIGTGGPGALEVTDGAAASFKGYAVLGSQAQLYAPDGTPTGLMRTGEGSLLVSGAGSSFAVGTDPDGGSGSVRVGYTGAGAMRVESGASASVAGVLIVGDGADGTLELADGGMLSATGADSSSTGLVVGNKAGATGAVTVSGAGSKLSVDQAVQVGNDGVGSLDIVDGATAELAMHGAFTEVGIGDGYASGAQGSGTGHILVDGAGSVLKHAGGMNVLEGTLDIRNGGQVVSVARAEDAQWAPVWVDEVGADLGDGSSVAVATVTGAGSAWNSRNSLQIAYGGTGTLSVLDGAAANFAGFAIVGNRSAVYGPDYRPTGEYVYGNASLLVSGDDSSFTLGASENGAGDFTVARYGTGGATATDGGSIAATGVATVGGQAGASGSLHVGDGGTMVVAGSDANGIGLTIGDAAGSTGSVTVSGAGSTLTIDAGAQVGDSGTGSLSVLDGAHVGIALTHGYSEIVAGFGYYGWGVDTAQGRGSITVDGTGSLLEYAGGLNLLNGDMAVADGGVIENVARGTEGIWIDMIGFGVPADPDPTHDFHGLYGDASVVVSGAGSAWNSLNALRMGDGGDGLLQVLDGGQAAFAGFADLGHASYLYDGIGGSPVPGLAPQSGSGYILVSGAGSKFSLSVAPGAPTWGLGVMRMGIDGDGGLAVADGGSATIAGGIEVGANGIVLIGGADPDTGDLTLVGAGTLDTPSIALLDPSSALLLHHASTDAVLAAAISGTGYIDASAGTTRLTGDSSAFAGATNIDGGATLAVSGALGGAMPYVGSEGAGTLAVDGGGDVHVTGSADYGNGLTLGMHDGSSGTATVTGAGSTLTVDAGTQIGHAGAGTLSVLAGGTANLGLETGYSEVVMGLGYYGWGAESGDGSGTLRVDGAGSTVNYAGGLNVLDGTVSITGGGEVAGAARPGEGGWIDMIGFGVPADPDPAHDFDGLRGTASVTVSGEGSAWNSLNGLDVGDGGDGTLSVLAGAAANFHGNVYLGGQSYLYDAIGGGPVPGLAPQTGTGAIRVSGAGSSLAIDAGLGTNGWLDIGHYGDGNMAVSDGATASVAYTLYLGEYANGTLSVTGGGTMSVLGANASAGGNLIGVNQGATGTLSVGGTGSELSFAGGLQVGNAGTGVMSVLAGGTVNAGLDIAYAETLLGFGNYGWATGAENGKGTMTVDGAGSTFNYAGGLNVLNGTVNASNGGTIASHTREADGTAFWTDVIGFGVPANPDGSYAGLHGTGSVFLDGSGTTWTSVNGLNVGYGGEGSLVVIGGAKASFTGYAELGKLSRLYDSPTGSPIPGIAGQAGTGTLLVSGLGSSFAVSAIEGNTTWGTGVLELGSEGPGSVTVNNGGAVSAPGGIVVGAQGTFTVGGMQGGALTGWGTVSAPSIALADPSATLAFDHNDNGNATYIYLFAPVVSGNGHIDVASGFTRLTGDSSAFAGDTTIDTGATLSVNGSLGGDISVDGRLQGTGTVGNVTVNDGGILAPGNSPGTLHVDGDLVMQTGSVYEAEIDSDTGMTDSISVAGDVTIESGTVLSVSNLGTQPLTPGADIQLIQTVGETSTVEGQFDSVVGGSELLDFGVSYENGQIQVSAERSETTNFASIVDESFGSLGVALDGIPDDSALTKLVFTEVTTAAAAAALVDDMAGTMHADLRRVMLEDSRYARTAIGERLRDDDASGGVAWARAMGGSASAEGNDALPGTTVDHSGVMVGYDAAVGDSRLGIAIGTDKGSYAADGKDATANLYDRHVALYGRSLLGGLRLGYGLAFGATDAKASRSFDIGSARQSLQSKHEARTAQGFVDFGYRFDGGSSFRYVEPFLNVARVQVKDDAATEEGSVAALEIAAGDTSATFGTIGLRWKADMGVADFAGSIGWRHAFGFDGATATQAFVAGGPSFTIDSLPVDNAVIVDLGARFRMTEHARVWFGYDGMLAGSAHDHGLKLQVNLDL
jgi:outer membrane autotransporter protein